NNTIQGNYIGVGGDGITPIGNNKGIEGAVADLRRDGIFYVTKESPPHLYKVELPNSVTLLLNGSEYGILGFSDLYYDNLTDTIYFIGSDYVHQANLSGYYMGNFSLSVNGNSLGNPEGITFNESKRWMYIVGEPDKYSSYENVEGSYYNLTHYNFTNLASGTYFYNVTFNDTEGNVQTTLTRNFTITGAPDTAPPVVSDLSEIPTDPAEYSEGLIIEFNATVTDDNLDTVLFEFDGTNYTPSNVDDNYNFTITGLTAGTYNYVWYANDSGGYENNTESGSYTIDKNDSYELVLPVTTPIEYPTETDFTGEGCPSELTCSLNITNGVFGVGTVSANYSTAGNTNYSGDSLINTTTINQNSSYVLGISGTSPIDYGTISDVAGSDCPSQLSCSLDISNDIYGVELSPLTFNYSTAGNTNYSTNSITIDITIDPAVPEGSISGTSPITYGTAGDVEGTENNVNDSDTTYTLYRDGVAVNNPDTTTLGVGTYNYIYNATAGTNYTDNESMGTFELTVNQLSSLVNLTLNNTEDNITIQINNQIDLNCSTITGDSGATLKLFNDGSIINEGTSPLYNLTTFSSGGLKNITCIYENSQNYSTSYKTYYVTVNDTDTEYPQFSSSSQLPANNTEYSEDLIVEFNITITSTNGTAGIELDGTNYSISNVSDIYNYTSKNLNAGVHSYYYWSYGNGTSSNYNMTELYSYTISKNSSYVLGISGTSPIDYGTISDVAGSDCPSQLSCSLDISNDIYGVELSPLTFNYSTAGNTNYSTNSITIDITIDPAVPEGSISGTSPITYGTAGDVEGTENNVNDSDTTYTLYRDGVAVNNPDTTTLGVGTYNYIYNATAGTNYTDNESMGTFELTVNKNASQIVIYINHSRDNLTIYNNTIAEINATTLTGEGEITIYRDGDGFNQGSSPLYNSTNFTTAESYHNFTAYHPETENYTKSYDTLFLNVTAEPDLSPPIFDNLRNFSNTVNTSFSESITASHGSGIDTYTLNQTDYFTINGATGLITNSSNLSEIMIHWLNISVNSTTGSQTSGIFYINITPVSPPPNVTTVSAVPCKYKSFGYYNLKLPWFKEENCI
ncbi:MAG: SdiA-regulated domain-containing protein, partial [Promethearchaeota archaeon]